MAGSLRQGLTRFGDYVAEVEALASRALSGEHPDDLVVSPELDGRASSELRLHVRRDVRRQVGAFFTGSILRSQAVPPAFANSGLTLDPACGGGDLLLAVGQQLPTGGSLEKTIAQWGERLAGADLEETFVRLARARLVLLAHARTTRVGMDHLHLEECFPRLVVADGIEHLRRSPKAAIIVNPPFGGTTAPSGCTWGTGLVSEAALFFERCLEAALSGTRVAAILPDVLRSGSRYAKWRRHVETLMSISAVEPVGRFDSDADVDVFLLQGVAGAQAQNASWWPAATSAETVGDHFRVWVGPVVPHRDREVGPLRRYIHARLVSGHRRYDATDQERAYAGRTFDPPFVVVPRTSRPNLKGQRLWATVVVGTGPVAVENHLLVLKPLHGGLNDCRAVARLLQSDSTTTFLNDRLRCRHLTTGAVAQIPWRPS